MNFALISIVLALIWAAITASFSVLNLLLGWGIGLIALWFVREHIASPVLLTRARRIVALGALFFYELTLSAIRVAILVLTPNLKAQLKPAIIAFPLTAKSDPEITLLANLITLTPGTLSVDVSEDRKVIYVHVLSLTDKAELIRGIASGFENRIIEVFQ
jgi:multicomponent Na+:H+ antiporter subunit E